MLSNLRRGKAGIKEISKEIGFPELLSAKILQDLSRKGLVHSTKGPNGGFFLDERLLEGSLADIVKSVDGEKISQDAVWGCSSVQRRSHVPSTTRSRLSGKACGICLEGAKLSSFLSSFTE